MPASPQTPAPQTATGERAEAAALMVQASTLLAQRTPAAVHDSVAAYEQALRTWQGLGETSRQVEALVGLATARYFLNEKDQTAALLEQAGEVARGSGNRADEAMVLTSLAIYHNALGELPQAREAAAAAADIDRSLGQQEAEVKIREMLGRLDNGLQNAPSALADYERCLELARAIGDRRIEALSLLWAAQASSLLNRSEDFNKAAAYFAEAIPLFEATSDSFNLASSLWGLATADDQLGRKEPARDAYLRALPLFAAPGYQRVRASILLSLAEDEQALGNFDKARADFEQALPLFVSPADDQSRGLALTGLGSVRESLGDVAGALNAYTDAASVWHSAKDNFSEAPAQLRIGNLRLRSQEWQAALDAFDAALKLGEAAQDKLVQAEALDATASVYLTRGDNRRSLAAAERAAGLLEGDGAAEQRTTVLLTAGKAASELHENAKALGYLDQVVALGELNPAGKAGALATEASIFTGMGDARKALDLLHEALGIIQAQHNEAMVTKLANDIGLAYSALGRKAEALKLFEQSLAAARQSGNTQQQAAILSNLAQIHQGFGETAEAIRLYKQALTAADKSGDRNVEAITLSSFGMAYHVSGDEPKAIETLEKALAIRRDLGDIHGAAITLNNLALVYDETGDPQKALDTYSEARVPFGRREDPENEAVTLNNIGTVYRGLGANDRARSYYQQALDIFNQTDDDEGRASTLNNLAVLTQSDGAPRAALLTYEKALAIVEKLGKRPEQARLLSAMGVAHSQLEEHEAALNLLNQSLAIAHETGNVSAEALALHNLGTEHEQMGDLDQAMNDLQKALPLLRQTHNAEFEATTLFVIARIELAQGSPEAALRHVDESIGLSESLRSRLGSEDLRASLLARATGAYELKIEMLMRSSRLHPNQGDDARALETSEQARARSLLDLLSESHAKIRRGVDPEALREEQAIRRELSAKAVQQAKLPSDSPEFAELDHQITELIAAYEQREAAIRTASPAYAALTQPQALNLTQIQHLLEPGTLLLEYALGKERSYVWAVTQSELNTYELPSRAVIEAAVLDFHNAIPEVANPQNFDRASARLSAMLLKPVAHELGRKRLVVVSDAALQAAVPFAALVSPSAPPGAMSPLVVDHEIIQEPSASIVAALRAGMADRLPPQGLVAVLADPVVSADDPRLLADKRNLGEARTSIVAEISRSVTSGSELERLPNSSIEARSILALIPKSRALSHFGFDASKAHAENPALGNYRIVHFATHGLLNQRNPELSGLVFSLFKPDGTSDDGYLRLGDVFNLSLPVDLVVLSACESGQGKVVGGEGLVGLTRGFFYAGAGRLVVSLRDVDDLATAVLMKEFYRQMLGRENLRPPAALRHAQIAMINSGRWKHPAYWAPFIAEGEWR